MVKRPSIADGNHGRTRGFLMTQNVVGLAGPRGCGKSTISKHLVNQHGFERLAFSDVLREIAMLAGPEHVDDRHYLADLGEILRVYEPKFLLNAMKHKLETSSQKVVIEDVRFPQELDFCRTNGVITVYLDLERDEQIRRVQCREGCSAMVAHRLVDIADNHLLGREDPWDIVMRSEGDFQIVAHKIASMHAKTTP